MKVQVNPCTTADFPRPALRPANSVFEHMSIKLNNFNSIRHWKEALSIFLKNT
ncbi:sugar nucleotide-binding protein [Priestia megaterium]